MRLPGPVLTLILIPIGMFLAYLSGFVVPLGYGVTIVWLGILVVANGSIWFGVWGVIAGTVFPFLTSLLLLDVDIAHVVTMLPANMLEGLIPAAFFRVLKANPALENSRDLAIYGVGAILIPPIIGGLMTSWFWLLLDLTDWQTFKTFSFDWALSDMLVLIVFGIPAMMFLTPILRRRGLLVEGWLH